MQCIVLFEDHAGAEPKDFGPYTLLLACLEDATGQSRWELKEKVIGIPKKGNGNLKKSLEHERDRLSKFGQLFAVFDDDQVRRCYGLPKNACKQRVLSAIRGEPPKINVVLIERNMESLVEVCREVLGMPPLQVKPTPAERDGILQKVAAQDRDRSLRDEVLKKCPSFARLVNQVRGVLGTGVPEALS